VGKAVLGGLEILYRHQQFQIVLLAPHQDEAILVEEHSHHLVLDQHLGCLSVGVDTKLVSPILAGTHCHMNVTNISEISLFNICREVTRREIFSKIIDLPLMPTEGIATYLQRTLNWASRDIIPRFVGANFQATLFACS